MTSERTLARIAGILYLVTFATSIPAVPMKAPFLAGGADPTLAISGYILEIVLALACIGTAVALFPLLRRHDETFALGFVGTRTVEAGLILVGVTSVAALVAVRAAGDDGGVLVAIHDAAFLIGPGLMPAFNALMLATVLYRARLVPRIIPLVGLVGAPLLAASAVLAMFGVMDQVSPAAALLALPIALWEFSIGVWLIVRGVRGDVAVRGAERVATVGA